MREHSLFVLPYYIFVNLFIIFTKVNLKCYNAQSMSIAFQDTLGHIRPRATPEVQEKAAEDVAKRLLGEKISKLFVMMVDTSLARGGKDSFKVEQIHSPIPHNLLAV